MDAQPRPPHVAPAAITDVDSLIAALAHASGQPFDRQHFRREHPGPHDTSALLQGLDAHGYDLERLRPTQAARAVRGRLGLLIGLEWIAEPAALVGDDTSGAPQPDDHARTLRPVLIQLVQGGRAVTFRPGEVQPRIDAIAELPLSELHTVWALQRRVESVDEGDPPHAAAAPTRRFGFRSLLPEVLIGEATSNPYAATAEAFARTVNALRGQATILFIAHQVPRGLAVDRVARLASPAADIDMRTPVDAEAKQLDTIRPET